MSSAKAGSWFLSIASALALVAGAFCVPSSAAPHGTSALDPNMGPSWYSDPIERDADAAFARKLTREDAIQRVLTHEGGFSNHASDPGGATRYGITARTARTHGYRGPMNSLPMSEAVRIYRMLWDESGAAQLEGRELAISAFDAYIAHGPRATRWYATLSGDDGCISINRKRLSVYRGSANWGTFGRGWSKRVTYNLTQCNAA